MKYRGTRQGRAKQAIPSQIREHWIRSLDGEDFRVFIHRRRAQRQSVTSAIQPDHYAVQARIAGNTKGFSTLEGNCQRPRSQREGSRWLHFTLLRHILFRPPAVANKPNDLLSDEPLQQT